MNKEGHKMDRCKVARLMKRLGLHGVRRGKVVRTRVPDKQRHARWAGSTVNSKQVGPAAVGVELHLCQHLAGLAIRGLCDRHVCPAHRGLAGSAMRTDFVLNTMEQPLFGRHPEWSGALIHNSDRRSQYVSLSTPNAWPKLE